MTILFESNPTTAAALVAAISPDPVTVASQPALQSLLNGDAVHDLVVVGPDVDAAVALELAAAQRITRPTLGVVLVRRRVHSSILRDAMVAGVREVVPSDDVALLGEACARSLALSEQVRRGQGVPGGVGLRMGEIITVFAAKGGCGKTTVATNLAAALAHERPRRVCLLDLDLAFGDVAIAMQLTPQRTIADAVALSTLDETAVRSLVTPHPSGVDTILAPVEPGSADAISGSLIADLLRVLKTMYEVVIVDSPPAFTDHVLASFDASEHFILLATLDIPALKNLKLTLETLEMLSYPRERWHVVLNRSDAKVGLSVDDVERTLRTQIALQIPSSRAVPSSVNRGVPIVLDQPGHAVSQAIRRFAVAQLLPAAAASPSATEASGSGAARARRGFGLLRRTEVSA
jgi:pilus assembly protein CpaE